MPPGVRVRNAITFDVSPNASGLRLEIYARGGAREVIDLGR